MIVRTSLRSLINKNGEEILKWKSKAFRKSRTDDILISPLQFTNPFQFPWPLVAVTNEQDLMQKSSHGYFTHSNYCSFSFFAFNLVLVFQEVQYRWKLQINEGGFYQDCKLGRKTKLTLEKMGITSKYLKLIKS